MTCVKRDVRCIIQTIDGDIYEGRNSCDNPQYECPREFGEDYTKCKTICKQEGHAEEIALKNAMKDHPDLTGATAYIEGIDHYCKNCQHKLFNAGVESLRLIK